MRFVAGGGAAAKLQTSLGLQRRAIGKMLLTGAAAELLTGRGAVAKLLPAVALRRRAIGKLLLAGVLL